MLATRSSYSDALMMMMMTMMFMVMMMMMMMMMMMFMVMMMTMMMTMIKPECLCRIESAAHPRVGWNSLEVVAAVHLLPRQLK